MVDVMFGEYHAPAGKSGMDVVDSTNG